MIRGVRKMKKLKLFLLLVLMIFLVPLCSVDASDEKKVSVGDEYYYFTTKDNKYGTYYGKKKVIGTAESYTRYKFMGEGAGENPVYCVQSEEKSPQNGDYYVEIEVNDSLRDGYWTEENMWVSAFIIQKIEDDYSKKTPEGYVMTYAALNSYLSGKLGGQSFDTYNTRLQTYINAAKDMYNKYI